MNITFLIEGQRKPGATWEKVGYFAAPSAESAILDAKAHLQEFDCDDDYIELKATIAPGEQK